MLSQSKKRNYLSLSPVYKYRTVKALERRGMIKIDTITCSFVGAKRQSIVEGRVKTLPLGRQALECPKGDAHRT